MFKRLTVSFPEYNYRPIKLHNTVVQVIERNTPHPKHQTWKEYWSKYSGNVWPKSCRRRYCDKEASSVAHVIVDDDESSEYLIPMCKEDIENCSEVSVNSRTVAVYIDQEKIRKELVDGLVGK